MAINPMGTIPLDMFEKQQELNRQQRMAQALMQQGQQMPQGQMVSGRFVPPSFFQNIAPLVQTYLGSRMAEQGDKQALDLAKQLRQRYGDELREFRSLMQGREATPERTTEMAGPFGEGVGPNNMDIPMPTATMPAILSRQANPQLAYDFAASASNPALQQVGLKKLAEGPIKVGVDDTLLDPVTKKPIFQGAGKQPDSIRYAIAVGQLPPNPKDWSPQQAAYAKQLVESKGAASAINLGQKGLDNTLKLRGDFRSEPIYKDFQAIDSAYRIINKSLDAGTAAGDLGAATKLMKLLDPDSVVRESELAMAMQATGKLDQLYNYANKISTGQFLNPKQKDEFRALSKEFFNSAAEQYNLKRNEYAGIAQRNQLDVTDVVGNEVKLKPQIIKPVTGKPSAAKPAAEKTPPAPKGFDQKLWNVMTPEERALF